MPISLAVLSQCVDMKEPSAGAGGGHLCAEGIAQKQDTMRNIDGYSNVRHEASKCILNNSNMHNSECYHL